MPELPEVELIRLFLNNNLLNKTIKKIEVLNQKSFIGDSKDILNQKIISFSRLGKQLSINLENNLTILIHLKMTGQLIYEITPLSKRVPAERGIFGHSIPLKNQHPRVIFFFSDKSKLIFNDQRKFGWIKIFSNPELVEAQKNIGPDILSKNFTNKYFYNTLQSSSRTIKTILMDQKYFAGIGNIYANDALFLSKIHPNISSKKITKEKSYILHKNIKKIIKESIKNGGSTARDNKYLHPDGTSGGHQYFFRVYQKLGEPCSNCSTLIKSIKTSGRSSFYCPNCQKLSH